MPAVRNSLSSPEAAISSAGRVHTVGESFHILLTLLDTKGENQPARSRATGLKKAKEQVRAITRAARRLFGVEEQRISLEELVHAPVLSGSRTYESSLMTPAWNITLTGKELRDRGYTELSEIFDDLPGIDVVRPRGASWLRTYWRGRRDTWQDHFLFLIDDIPWHDHLYGNARMQIPLSNIERVEVFYGPGSLMHGANALMGVVQVITKRELKVLEQVYPDMSEHRLLGLVLINSSGIAKSQMLAFNMSMKTTAFQSRRASIKDASTTPMGMPTSGPATTTTTIRRSGEKPS